LSYLLDTNIISAVAPTKTERPAALIRWLDEASQGLYLSVVTAAEIRDGIAKALREGGMRSSISMAAKFCRSICPPRESRASSWTSQEALAAPRALPTLSWLRPRTPAAL
jgi:predicted nucleic acid-binding protein